MGVDFFPCDRCGESICDCGNYESCDCGRRWCERECAKLDGYDPDEIDGCAYCRLENAEDSELLDFLLRQYNLTRESVLKEWRDEQRKPRKRRKSRKNSTDAD